MRDKYFSELGQLNQDIISLGALCQRTVKAATEILLKDKDEKIKEVRHYRERIDEDSRAIEDTCMQLLIRQQPLGKDMNQIANSLKLIRDMQRIGSQAVELASIAKDIEPEKMRCIKEIRLMTQTLLYMISRMIESFTDKNIIMADEVIQEDDELDTLYSYIKNELSNEVFDNKKETENAIDLLMAAKYLERIGDHTVMIASWIKDIIK